MDSQPCTHTHTALRPDIKAAISKLAGEEDEDEAGDTPVHHTNTVSLRRPYHRNDKHAALFEGLLESVGALHRLPVTRSTFSQADTWTHDVYEHTV